MFDPRIKLPKSLWKCSPEDSRRFSILMFNSNAVNFIISFKTSPTSWTAESSKHVLHGYLLICWKHYCFAVSNIQTERKKEWQERTDMWSWRVCRHPAFASAVRGLLDMSRRCFVFQMHPPAQQGPRPGQEEIKLISSVPSGSQSAKEANL